MNSNLNRFLSILLLLLLFLSPAYAAEEEIIPPAWDVPDYVTALLEVASEEVGYTEDHGRTKYGEWAGDPAAQWCAEFVCWCVDQVDQRTGTSLLRSVYPYYTSSNTGKNWFIKAGRYVVRKGRVEGWGYEWLKGSDSFIKSGDYIPQPGDWVFFNWGGGTDTEHVAMVEYCTRDGLGKVTVHVIDGTNAPSVQRNEYDLNSGSILGYGTVHDVADITMTFGCLGEKVYTLQEKLAYLGYLDPSLVTGRYGDGTAEAVRASQDPHKLKVNGIANLQTQARLDAEYTQAYDSDPDIWGVVDDEDF